MEYSIANGLWTVRMQDAGATLTSIRDARGTELLWQGDEASWTGRDVVIFPFVGRMLDGAYTHDGRLYRMPTHGLCAEATFRTQMISEQRCRMQFCSDARTKSIYPFDFRFTVTRTLDADILRTRFRVDNTGDREMYFGLGGHPAFALVGDERADETDTSGNFLEFCGNAPSMYYPLQDGKFLLDAQSNPLPSRVELTKDLMRRYATVLWTGSMVSCVRLIRRDGIEIETDYGDAPVLGLWSHEKRGAYMCVEPWWGTPDFVGAPSELKDKRLLQRLAPQCSFERGFDIRIARRSE